VLSKALIVLLVLSSRAYGEITDSTRLTTGEIRQVFSDVRDDARVQDAANTSAVNFWCSSGAFTSAWSNGEHSGKVAGRWRAVNDQRCVVIESGLEEVGDTERCGPILRHGPHYLSVNPDRSIHGVHALSTMTAEERRLNCPASRERSGTP
jgi:hypothetical protein